MTGGTIGEILAALDRGLVHPNMTTEEALEAIDREARGDDDGIGHARLSPQEAYDIEIADEVAEKITTVKDAIDHVNQAAG